MRHPSGFASLSVLAIILALSPALSAAKPTVKNLGGGLEQLTTPLGQAKAMAPAQKLAAGGEAGLEASHRIVMDDAGRALVRITLDGKVPAATLLKGLKLIRGVEVVASDPDYRKGAIEAYVPGASLIALAGTKGVLAVVPASPLMTNVGLTDSQGVVQHRVDKIAGVDGAGVTVGVMSDSYDTNAAPNSAALDIASGDLPGAGNPAGNTEPVVVLQDVPGTDEGRAMLQIVHDMASKARLGFATANGGELNFADNIRSLAGFGPRSIPGFEADVIVDDIIYLAEPFFQDGPVAQAVDEVAAAGVSYFSSAGNRAATMAYDSKPRIVPASNAGTSGLNFTNVDPALYAGGFHDFADGDGVDIAQTVSIGPQSSTMVFQWNEPFDPVPPTPVGPPIATGTGTVPLNSTDDFTFNGTAGQIVEVFVDGDPAGPGDPHPDLTITLFDPDGVQIGFVDATTNPESLTVELPKTGLYTAVIGSFVPASQSGDYLYRVQEVSITEQVLSDYNILFFSSSGATFFGALAEQNLFTNRPLELGGFGAIGGVANIQVVIARANTPDNSNRNVADRIRYVWFTTGSPQEHFSYLGPVTYGHNSAAGAMGVAAYPFFAPFVPEGFTSPGPSTIYFDVNNNRFHNPQFRKKPDLAAMDGANNTFFGADNSADPDTFPNFFGTSAAAPHAAAIAALVLDAAGGPGSVKPGKMRKILQDSAFRHDLDPYNSTGIALTRGNLLTVNASADANAISQFDPNVFTLWQIGSKKLQSFSLNGSDANPTQTPKGIVFDERPTVGQAFIVGDTDGILPSDVTNVFSLPADPPGAAGQWKQLNLSFLAGTFGSGDRLSFGVDRDEADAAGPVNGAVGGNSADLLGGGVLIPSGQTVPGGASFFGNYESGGTFDGEFFNIIGKGYSRLDGFGFINAEAAVKAVTEDDDD